MRIVCRCEDSMLMLSTLHSLFFVVLLEIIFPDALGNYFPAIGRFVSFLRFLSHIVFFLLIVIAFITAQIKLSPSLAKSIGTNRGDRFLSAFK